MITNLTHPENTHCGITTTPSVQAGGQALHGEAGNLTDVDSRRAMAWSGPVTCLTGPHLFDDPGRTWHS